MKKITIIIPFLNEGEEVEKTLKSIREYSSSEEVSILLIDDASTDGFDYAAVANQYNAIILVNNTRQGVAASRDRGILTCLTPYVLLMDAHMRLYDVHCIPSIIKQLEQNENVLLCCQNKPLRYIDGKLNEQPINSQGAYIDLNTYEAHWHYTTGHLSTSPTAIPCVLGAAYATSKQYWLSLGGLKGLRGYGMDEQYISLKVGLEGGRCMLLPHCVIGHIYRNKPPYYTPTPQLLYNKLFIAELLLPFAARIYLHANLQSHTEICTETLHLLSDSKPLMLELIPFYHKRFTRSIWDILLMNCPPATLIPEDELPGKLHDMAIHLLVNHYKAKHIGLFHGKMGIVIFLCAYARFSGEFLFEEFADKLLDEIIEALYTTSLFDFSDGICGIGWGLQYLIAQGWLEGSSSELLSEIDHRLMGIHADEISDNNFSHGMGGFLFYVLSRLQFQEKEKSPIHFSPSYIEKLKKRASCMLSAPAYFLGIDIPYAFLAYLDNKQFIIDTSDIKAFISPYLLISAPPSLGLLDGWAGKGILSILTSSNRPDSHRRLDEH